MENLNTDNTENKPEVRIFNPRILAENGTTGELFEGTYVKYEETERQTAAGRKFTSKAHHFIGTKGEPIIVNSTGLFNHYINKREYEDGTVGVKPGEFVKVLYFGMDDSDRHVMRIIK